MEGTYPLREDLIQGAIDELSANNARAVASPQPMALTWQEARQQRSGALHARVTGPVGGYFIASFAARTDDAARMFVGEYKICQVRPASYWDAVSLLAGTCRHTEGTGAAALASAEAAASLKIDGMPILV